MSWMEEFADRATGRLRDVPYRVRARAELLDHLGSLYQAGLDRGLTKEEARGEALDKIGPLPALRRQYRQAELALRCQGRIYGLSRVLLGACLIGALYILIYIVSGTVLGVTYDAVVTHTVFGRVDAIPLLGADPTPKRVLAAALFLFPFGAGALWLRRAFRFRTRPLGPIAAGLLLAWGGEKLAILSISALLYNLPLWDLSALMYRINAGGDQSAPWFTVPYIAATLAGTLLLVLLAARIPNRGQKSVRAR